MDPRERKLKENLWPAFISVRQLKDWKPIRLYKAQRSFNQLLTILLSVGVSHPAILFAAGQKPDTTDSAIATVLGNSLTGWICLALLIVWEVFKMHLRNEEVEKKYNLIKAVELRFQTLQSQCQDAIQTSDPSSVLDSSHRVVAELIQTCTLGGAWPPEWTNQYAPGAVEQARIDVDSLIQEARNNLWIPINTERRPKADVTELLARLDSQPGGQP